MRAVSLDYNHRDLRERDIPEPLLDRHDQVLFRILQVGICGTDRELASFQFGYGPTGSDFLVLGHEAVGEVLLAGSAAHDFRPGDLVVPLVRRACPQLCRYCAGGRRDLCTSGGYTERGIFGAHGYFTELAVDQAADLVRVSPNMRSYAVLIEPLSVVEKAISLAYSLHQGVPEHAVVLGAGTIGLLAAAVLRQRGLSVDVISIEPMGSRRVQLAELAEARYLMQPERQADILIEAAGSPSAADAGLRMLAPLGVMIVLGAKETAEPAPLLDLIVGNRVIAGSVNASPDAFRIAVQDLPRLPHSLLAGLIERTNWTDYRRAITGQMPTGAPKIVHVLHE